MWIYSAIMNAAAEFRAVTSLGTDFDATGDLDVYKAKVGASGGLATWCVYASSALGKEIYFPEPVIVGAEYSELHDKDAPQFRIVGPLTGYRAEIDGDRATLKPLDDYSRQPYHSKLLFLLGLLPESKIGTIKRRDTFSLELKGRRGEVGAIRHKHLGSYLIMSRLFGYDVTARLVDGTRVSNWSDNNSRIAWAPGELSESGDALARIVNVEERPEAVFRRKPSVYSNVTFNLELECTRVFSQYDYGKPIVIGDFPRTYKLENPDEEDGPRRMTVYTVEAPRIVSKTEDFGVAREPSQVLEPGQEIQAVELREPAEVSLSGQAAEREIEPS